MINPPAEIATDGVPDAIIIKSILPRLLRMVPAEDIRQPPGNKVLISFPDFRIKRNMPEDSFGVMNVDGFRRDVKITAQN
jgi:hypothetical protein